ncbi:hypothetical protein VTP01DRAFT_4245 [Rhizomucor pusillus]|uniref:uncharacterized protein n=1 Tax=Rhizomucor pusillus TaxID=4840 RepID=UPI0037444F67
MILAVVAYYSTDTGFGNCSRCSYGNDGTCSRKKIAKSHLESKALLLLSGKGLKQEENLIMFYYKVDGPSL